MKSPGRLGAVLLAVVLCAACAEVPVDPEARAEFEELNDPLEPTNRAVFAFNNALDKAVLVPVSKGYRAAVPGYGRDRVHAAVENLKAPFTFANDVLQGEGARAGETLMRFMINSTAGLGGLFDLVGETGGPRAHDEDVGQTLAVWGVDEGPYLMLPLLGPSNSRDAVGRGIEFVADPTDIVLGNAYDALPPARAAAGTIDLRTQLLDPIADLERNSLDYYAAIRSLYRQRRASQIANKEKPLAEAVKSAQ